MEGREGRWGGGGTGETTRVTNALRRRDAREPEPSATSSCTLSHRAAVLGGSPCRLVHLPPPC
eukprot:8838052-Pyramimonas_sp.AAC.1